VGIIVELEDNGVIILPPETKDAEGTLGTTCVFRRMADKDTLATHVRGGIYVNADSLMAAFSRKSDDGKMAFLEDDGAEAAEEAISMTRLIGLPVMVKAKFLIFAGMVVWPGDSAKSLSIVDFTFTRPINLEDAIKNWQICINFLFGSGSHAVGMFDAFLAAIRKSSISIMMSTEYLVFLIDATWRTLWDRLRTTTLDKSDPAGKLKIELKDGKWKPEWKILVDRAISKMVRAKQEIWQAMPCNKPVTPPVATPPSPDSDSEEPQLTRKLKKSRVDSSNPTLPIVSPVSKLLPAQPKRVPANAISFRTDPICLRHMVIGLGIRDKSGAKYEKCMHGATCRFSHEWKGRERSAVLLQAANSPSSFGSQEPLYSKLQDAILRSSEFV
jgi:hypothetical protein